MYRITRLDDHLRSPYELLFGRRPKSMLPSSESSLQSQHPNKDCHKEANLRKQTKQAAFYNTKTSPDKRAFSSNQPVYFWNLLKHIWEPCKVFNLPNPGREPITYLVEMQGKIYQRTREHLCPRVTLASHTSARECFSGLLISQDTPGVEASPPTMEMQAVPHPLGKAALVSSAVPAFGPDTIQAAPTQSVVPVMGTDTIQAPIGSLLKTGTGPEVSASKRQSTRFQLHSHTTKSGRKTQVPAKFKD